MAELVAEGARSVDGVTVDVRGVDMVTPDDLLEPEAIVMGSPVYFGTMAAELKKLIDDSVVHFTKLDGKIGGAFASSGGPHGGNETTVLDIAKALMVHGMIVKGVSSGAHYGPVAVGTPDDDEAEECRRYGYDLAELTIKLFG
jgi:NAD(P)H dehydrogenase (quinone)